MRLPTRTHYHPVAHALPRQGLGKTLQTLALIWTLMRQGPEVCTAAG